MILSAYEHECSKLTSIKLEFIHSRLCIKSAVATGTKIDYFESKVWSFLFVSMFVDRYCLEKDRHKSDISASHTVFSSNCFLLRDILKHIQLFAQNHHHIEFSISEEGIKERKCPSVHRLTDCIIANIEFQF